MTTREPPTIRTLTLADGRQLSFAEHTNHGRESDPPVLYCHGTPGSALEAPPGVHRMFDGSRFIVPERPGYGDSSPAPSPGLSAWAHDACELLDALNIDEVRIAGFSAGAAYALACAYALKERVREVFLFSPHGPLDAPNATSGMSPSLLAMFIAARQDPNKLREQLEVRGLDLDSMLNGFLSEMAPTDQTIGTHPDVRIALLDNLQRALGYGSTGLMADLRCLVEPWGVPLKDISTNVTVWLGDADRNTPPPMAEYLSAVLPNARLFRITGAGHLACFDNYLNVKMDDTIEPK